MEKLLIAVLLFPVFVILLPVMITLEMIPPLYFILGELLLGSIMCVFFILIFMFSRGVLGPVLTSRSSGKALWIIISATRRFVLATGTVMQRTFDPDDERLGDYLIDPDASFMWPHGVSGSIATTSRGISLRPDMIKAATSLKERVVGSWEELEARFTKDGKPTPEADSVVVEADETLAGKPLRVNDVIGFFHKNLNPSYIQSIIKFSVQKALEGEKKMPQWLIVGVAMLLVCGAVAYSIISGVNTSSTAQTQLGSCQSQLGACQARVVGAPIVTATTTTTVPTMFGVPVALS